VRRRECHRGVGRGGAVAWRAGKQPRENRERKGAARRERRAARKRDPRERRKEREQRARDERETRTAKGRSGE